MKKDLLKEINDLKQTLRDEKARILARIKEIDQALGLEGKGGSGQRRRIQNELPLKDAVIRVTSSRPLTKPEILAEVEKLGYRFNAANPVNSLNVVLYGRSPKFNNDNGRFSLMSGSRRGSQSAPQEKGKRGKSLKS